MFCKIVPENDRLDVNASNRFAWYMHNGGETQEEMEWRVTRRWLEENLPQMYIRNFDDLLRRGRELRPGELLSEISSVHYIERGYEDIIQKLRRLGADIRSVEEPEEAEERKAHIG